MGMSKSKLIHDIWISPSHVSYHHMRIAQVTKNLFIYLACSRYMVRAESLNIHSLARRQYYILKDLDCVFVRSFCFGTSFSITIPNRADHKSF